MKTSSGVLQFGKREEEAMRCVLSHVRRDISYRGGGTFTDGSDDNNPDIKEIAKATRGIELIEWILSAYGK